MESTQIILGNFPSGVSAEELAMYLYREVGIVDKCKVKQPRPHLPAHAFVHFVSADVAAEACRLAERERLVFQNCVLKCCITDGGAIQQPRKKGSILELRNVQLQMGYLTNSQEITLSWRGPKGCIFRVDLDLRKMYIFFDYNEAMSHGDDADLPRDIKLELSLKDLRLVREVQNMRGHKPALAMMLQFWAPPLISYKAADDDVYLSTQASLPDDEDPWIRTVDFTPDKSIGRCLTYIISVSPSEGTAFRNLLEYFRLQRLCKSSLEHLTCVSERKQKYQQHDFFLVPKHKLTSFNEMFLVTALVHHGILNVKSLTDEFYMTVKSNPPLAIYALQQMLTSRNPVYNGVKHLQQVMERGRHDRARQESKGLPPGCMMIRRLVFTPTRALCLPPEVERSNRVLRHFHQESDRFLRVSFLDDDLQKLSSALTEYCLPFVRSLSLNSKVTVRTDIYHRVLKILKQGFVLCGWRFSFLAYSPNQLREDSLWFFAGDAHQIRKWMGQFPTTNVAKCATRMGHCFSSTTATLKVSKEEKLDLPDIIRNGYTFSDGCGRIAPDFASKVAKMLNLSQVPTAYQIRYAGYKGVVTVWPIEPALHTRYKLGLRDSMHKFESRHTVLEVIGWTQFYPGYLNREIICLLSTLQVPNEVFEALQEAQLIRLDALFHDPTIAREVLMTTCTDGLHSTAVTMLEGGFSPKSETHLYNMLLSVRTYQLEDLVAKARIFVPQGRFLLGCMDETGLLQYGQCFVQVTGPSSKDCFNEEGGLCTKKQRSSVQIITGKVIMAKNPCLHPGDIRILEAVDVPTLHGMVDCLVVPQNGHRPHPHEASHSDLDGDIYFVSWDAGLIPPSGTSWEPMNFEPTKPRNRRQPVKIEDVMDFFVRSMANESLGVICRAHVVHADRSPHGALDEKCLHLAQLVTTALDYRKTGLAIKLPSSLRVKMYPDFLQKDQRITYVSEKITGILYRKVSKILEKEVEKLEQASHSPEMKSMYDKDLEVTGYEAYLEDAWNTKVSYDQHLLGLMGRFDVKREADMVTGCVPIQKSSVQHGDLKDRIKAAYISLRNYFRASFDLVKDEKSGLSPNSSGSSNLLSREEVAETSATSEESINFAAKASAWYHVTYHPDWIQRALELHDKAEDDSETVPTPLLSFAWLRADILAKVKISKLRELR